jgi:hypothetical protein
MRPTVLWWQTRFASSGLSKGGWWTTPVKNGGRPGPLFPLSLKKKNPGGLLAQRHIRGIRYIVILPKGCCEGNGIG